MPTTENFFENLSPTDPVSALKNQDLSVAAPKDWFLFITDIKGSTDAIQAGKYRDVNLAGALCIMAIINSMYYRKIPFIFGGDGVMFLVPAKALRLFSDLMQGVRQFTHTVLSLDLRIGIVPMTALYEANKPLRVGKLSFGHGGCLATFEGTGIEWAEKLVKQPHSNYLLSVDYQAQTPVNFEGFFCPFSDIPSKQGCVMALIIKPLRLEWQAISNALLTKIGNAASHHPLDAKVLTLNRTAKNINLNAAVISGKNAGIAYHLRQLAIKLKFYWSDWFTTQAALAQTVQANMIPASDYQKYDGNYKIVFRCDEQTRDTVIQWLKEQEADKNFVFGYHLTDRSIMTCLFDGKGDDRELHLIDAADGGYALAATMLKEKLSVF